jgi:hypothetical protein
MTHLVKQWGIAFGLFLVIITVHPFFVKNWNGTGDVDKWVNIKQLEVAKFVDYGQDPMLFYDREILRKFTADWTASIQRADELDSNKFLDFCIATETKKIFDAGSELPKERLTLSWMVNYDPVCDKLKTTPGFYRLVVTLSNIDRGAYYKPSKVEVISNVFRILEQGVIINEKAAATY